VYNIHSFGEKVKALILAGGFGTRLRPLSCTRPKLIFPVANKPILDWILNNLSKHGVTHVVLAVNYLADVLIHNFGDTKYGIDISYSYEKKPLGTGGPIKKAEDLLNDDNEPFLVLNGDILTSINYLDLLKMHKKTDAMATLALYEVEDPSRFGVVDINGKGQIRRFVEKPTIEDAPSKLINAGVYVLDQSIFEIIPEGRKISIEREILPLLAVKDRLYGVKFDGIWVDVGKPGDFMRANKLVLDLIASEGPSLEKNVTIDKNATIIPPVAIGKGAVIKEETCIGPYVSIGEGVTVSKGTKIEDSVIFSKAWINHFTSIRGAIIGEGAIIEGWVKIEDGCIVGDHAIINNNVTLTQNVKVCPSKEVSNSILDPKIVL
jgi:NDP-sugar pyrophosphorylase family protein